MKGLDPRIQRWIDMVDKLEVSACKEQHLLCTYVRKCFETENIYTDSVQLDKYLAMARYFPFERLFPWEDFCIALHLCTYRVETKRPRWPSLLLFGGRGLGKDGFIALEALCLTSPHCGIREYDVDICANAEEQAMRPVNDVISTLNNPENKKLERYYKWTKEQVAGIQTGGVIKGRTNNPKSKDGMRSGIVVFNEIHQYENYNNIKVFITGLGKKPHPRRLYATTNGDVRDGPLDEMLEKSLRILNGEEPDNGLLPFICRLDNKDEANDPAMWEKANPSLPYLPDLMEEITNEFEDWKANPGANADFMTKRMNLPQTDAAVAVTDYENIKATKRPLPDLEGWPCTIGIDYATVDDIVSVDFHFREGDIRYDINHSWLCLQSKDLHRIRAPWREWAEAKLLTLVDAVEIHPEIICEYIYKMSAKYDARMLGIDNYRYALMAKYLRDIGFDADERKNLKLVRPQDIMRIQPVINSVFTNGNFVWGDNPVVRWATRNTKLVKASKKIGSDTGNYYYAKIEAKSRKTDPFMAVVAAMVIEENIPETACVYEDIPVIIGGW